MIYASKLFEITSRHLPEVHCYTDDTQLYLSFKPGLRESHVEALSHMQRCIDDLRQWMLMDRLKLNDEKTEFLLVGTRQQLAKGCLQTEDRRPKIEDRRPKTEDRRPKSAKTLFSTPKT